MHAPMNRRVKMMTSWYTPWPRMFFIMVREMSGLFRPYGFRSNRASVGGSVARAREANVSMIRFTHSICTAFSGESCRETLATRRLFHQLSSDESGFTNPRLLLSLFTVFLC